MRIISIFLVLGLMLATCGIAQAGIDLSLDRDMLDFRTMENGQTLEISDQGVYHNQVTCTSTNNKTWYLKTNIVRPFTSGIHTISNDNFRWMVVDVVNGKGIVANNRNVETPFTDALSIIYTSDPVDNTGTPVILRFRYILTIPKRQAAGNYFATIRWTMVELL